MTDCIFCRIARGEIPAGIVERNDEFIAFRDIQPQAPTHVLVIPVRHLQAVRDASDAAGQALLGRLLAFTAKVASNLGLDQAGYRIVTNTGDHGGQSVAHLHLHILGGRQMHWPPG